MLSRGFSRFGSLAWLVLASAVVAACSGELPDGPRGWMGVCFDNDNDGYGFQCPRGDDCDDQDPTVHADCAPCSKPEEGCECEEGTAPVTCILPHQVTASGALMCSRGTRYCADGVWSECLGIETFTIPASEAISGQISYLIDSDAAVVCDPCHPDCYRVIDNLEILDGGPAGGETVFGPGGGITLPSFSDGGVEDDDPDEIDPFPPCTPLVGDDPDCDAIPNEYDPYPNEKPFPTKYGTIFFDLPPGEQGSHTFELQFYLNTADVYFLIDTTQSMDGEINNLLNSLTSGSGFLDNPATPWDDAQDCPAPPGQTCIECADRDFDGVPNNELKNQGITGATACLIRSSGFGAGWFREIPFETKDPYGVSHAAVNFVGYENRQDIDEDPSKTLEALKKFSLAGNISWPEAGIYALQAVATGEQIYTGWDRAGVPPRVCPDPEKQFGWPCFRKAAVPIVVLITDAPLMNGPDPDVFTNDLAGCVKNPYSSTSDVLWSAAPSSSCKHLTGDGIPDGHLGPPTSGSYSYKKGSSSPNLHASGVTPVNYHPQSLRYMSVAPDASYHPVSGNESFDTAYDVGDISNTFITYTGDTRGMSADVHSNNLGTSCSAFPSTSASSPGYPDAVFKFKVTDPNKMLTISTRGSHFKPALAIVPAQELPPLTTGSVSGNDTNAVDLNGGNPLGAMVNREVTQSISSFTGNLPRESFGQCMVGSSGTNLGRDAILKFTASADMQGVAFTTTSSTSGFNPVVALFEEEPRVPEDINITGPTPPGTANTNDNFFDWNIGAIDNRYVRLMGGSTAVSTITANFAANGFQSAPGGKCSVASGASPDAVIDFAVNETRRVRIETFDGTGSDSNMAASFDHLLALIERPVSLDPAVETVMNNDNLANARVITAASVPTSPGAWNQYTGRLSSGAPNTITMNTDDVSPMVMYSSSNANTNSCSAVPSNTHDVVYRFEVDAANQGTYDFDTVGSSFTTYLSLHKGGIGNFASVSRDVEVFNTTAHANQAAGSALDLGTINGKVKQFTGSNGNASSRWTAAQVNGGSGQGCRSSTSGNHREMLFKFTVAPGASIPVVIRNSRVSNEASVALFGPFTEGEVQDEVNFVDGAPKPGKTIPKRFSSWPCQYVTGGSPSGDELFPPLSSGTKTLAPGIYYVLVQSYTSNQTIQFNLTVADDTPIDLGTMDNKFVRVTDDDTSKAWARNRWTGTQIGSNNSNTSAHCRSSSSQTPPELVYKFTLTSTRNVTIRLSSNFSSSLSLMNTSSYPGQNVNFPGRLECAYSSSGDEVISRSLSAGTYYVVVHGRGTSNMGAFTLDVMDNAWDDGLIACNSLGPNSRLTAQNLTTGTYYLVIKGGTTNHDYKLNVRRSYNAQNLIACDYHGLSTRRGVIEATLEGGKNYSVIVRGRTANDKGTYGVVIRDLDYAPNPIGCSNTAGYTGVKEVNGNVVSSDTFFANLEAGKTYYLAVRSNNNTGGTYKLSMRSLYPSCAYDNTPYSDPSGVSYSSLGNAEVVRRFAPGEYYAVLKGRGDIWTPKTGDNGRGWYQITFGDRSLATDDQVFDAPKWGTDMEGVYHELVSRGIRVITVNSSPSAPTSESGYAARRSTDPFTKKQSEIISAATGAVSATGTPLRTTIKHDGTGMGYQVVQAIASLTQTLEMDVNIRLVDDLPGNDPRLVPPYNRHFDFVVRAIARPGNRCAGPVKSHPSLPYPDKFLNCAPGATPRFEIRIANPPAPNNVPLNPDDPKGGYNMRLDLIGDDAYIVDQIPVYVIPENVRPNPGDPIFSESGTYMQDITSNGCTEKERPIWQSLYWNASIPSNTKLEWLICGGDTQAELEACSSQDKWKTVATVTSGAACTDPGQCPNGYCSSGGVCEFAEGPVCTSDVECGQSGSCVEVAPTVKRCVWSENPVSLRPALASGFFNNKKRMRLAVRLFANPSRTAAPTVHDFKLNYLCTPTE